MQMPRASSRHRQNPPFTHHFAPCLPSSLDISSSRPRSRGAARGSAPTRCERSAGDGFTAATSSSAPKLIRSPISSKFDFVHRWHAAVRRSLSKSRWDGPPGGMAPSIPAHVCSDTRQVGGHQVVANAFPEVCIQTTFWSWLRSVGAFQGICLKSLSLRICVGVWFPRDGPVFMYS